jgi:hypothetical protein
MLLLPPEYSLEIQARIPTTLCVLHNFILTHDNIDVLMDEDCYARRTRPSSVLIRLKGGAHEETLRP